MSNPLHQPSLAGMTLVESVFEPHSSPLPGGERSDRDSDPGEGALLFTRDRNPSPQPSPKGRGSRPSSRLTVEPSLIVPYAEIGITTNFSFLRGGSHPQDYVHQAGILHLP